jgi:hypothetical protein
MRAAELFQHSGQMVIHQDSVDNPVCYMFLAGACHRGQLCDYAHTCIKAAEKAPSMRGKLCPRLAQTGTCEIIHSCDYSHTIDEARVFNQCFKTKMCEFAAAGYCKLGNTCRFAHSYAELRPGSCGLSGDSLLEQESPSVSPELDPRSPQAGERFLLTPPYTPVRQVAVPSRGKRQQSAPVVFPTYRMGYHLYQPIPTVSAEELRRVSMLSYYVD